MQTEKRVIALGFFDGVHLGHGALLRRVGEKAAELGAVPAAVTFDTHPENLILKTPAVPLLSSPLDRAELMRRFYGIREVIVAHFDERMMHMPWREFVTDYLAGEHGAVHLVAGHDFHFGYKGEGNPERLQALCGELGIGCDIIPKVVQDHITISSTYIRTLVAQGEMERANQFLGHPHTLTDTVAHGKKLGGTLGFPTVNLRFQPGVLVPAHGVYATRVTFENGESRPAWAAWAGYRRLLRTTGRAPSDYLRMFGPAPVLINMGVNGLIGMAFILATGGDLNGPTLGGILTIMGFSAFGKHARNITPIMLGVVIGGVFMHFDINQSSVQLALLFGTTLAPISGYFGWPFGIVAGFLHSSVVLHAGTPVEGINLYNNGFSGGLLAIVLYPIISEAIRHHRPGLQDRDYFDDTIEHDEPLVPPPARRK